MNDKSPATSGSKIPIQLESEKDRPGATRLSARDPIGETVLALAVTIGIVGGGKPALISAAASLAIGWALRRFGKGEYTAFRLFSIALAARNTAVALVSVVAGSRNSPIFPDEAQYAKISLEAASLLFGYRYGDLPPRVVAMAGPDGLRRFYDDGFAYLFSPLAAIAGPSEILAAMRSATAVCGALSVCALWWAGSKLAGCRAARRAAVVYALFPTSIFWSATALKEAAASALTLIGLGAIAQFSKDSKHLVRLRWATLVWVVWFLLLSIREHLVFVAAALAIPGTVALGLSSRLASNKLTRKRRWGSAATRGVVTLGVASTVLWASGYGVLGKDVVHSLDPGFLAERVKMETKGGARISPEAPESAKRPDRSGPLEHSGTQEPSTTAQSPEPDSPEESIEFSEPKQETGSDTDRDSTIATVRRLLKRLPGAALAVIVRPYPWEAPRGALGQYSGISRIFLFPSQLAWYGAFLLGLFGAWRLLWRFFAHALLLFSFPVVLWLFYGLTQANLGTAFRLREIFVPFVLLASAIPCHHKSSSSDFALTLILPTLGPGGTETHALDLARRLDEKGYRTKVVVLARSPSEKGDPESAANSAESRADVYFACRTSRYDLALPLRIATMLDKRECVSTYLFAGNFWGGLATRLQGASLISNIRTTHPRTLFQRAVEPLVIGDIVVCNSVSVAASAMKRGIPPRRIRVLHNGIDVHAVRASATKSRQDVLEKVGIPPDSFVLCLPARFDPLKDQLTAVEAFRLSSLANEPDTYLILVGSAVLEVERRYRSLVERSVENLDRVVVLDFYQPLAELLAASDVVLLSSVHEGMPNVLLEAGALGKPAVATKAGGTTEVIVDGETGLLAEPKDPRGLARALDRLAEDPRLREEMGHAAMVHIERHFSIHSEIDGFEKIIARSRHLYDTSCAPDTGGSRA